MTSLYIFIITFSGDSQEISITVLVDKNTAASLTAGEDTLEDILVLHLDNGKDYYISFCCHFHVHSLKLLPGLNLIEFHIFLLLTFDLNG